MRVTAEKKEQTRRALLAVAGDLFRENGFGATTTRQIASAAGVAAGTVFNYYPSKEAIAMALVGDALERAAAEFQERAPQEDASAEESLFRQIAVGLRHLEPCRPFLDAVLETGLGPGSADTFRRDHLQAVHEVLMAHGVGEPSIVTMHLYWTLYLGVLTFWITDASPRQEQTLAVLDQAMRMFVGALPTEGSATGENR